MLVAATRSEKFGSRRQSLLRSRPRWFAGRFGGYLDCWSREGQRFGSLASAVCSCSTCDRHTRRRKL